MNQKYQQKKEKLPTKLRITQWNARYLTSYNKIQHLLSLYSDITTVQEINHIPEAIKKMLPSLTKIQQRQQSELGGGTLLALHRTLGMSFHKSHQINKDCSLHRIILGDLKIIWMASVYLNRGTHRQIKEMFKVIQDVIPIEERKYILLIGDFNVNITKENHPAAKLIQELARTLQLTVTIPDKPTRKTATLDFIIKGKSIHIISHHVIPAPSDHKTIIWDISVDCPVKIEPTVYPNNKLAKQLTSETIEAAKKPQNELVDAIDILNEFLRRREEQRRKKNNLLKRITYKQRHNYYRDKLLEIDENDDIFQIIKQYWADFWGRQERLRFSQESKEAFDNFKRILNYHNYGRRDGSLVQQFINEHNQMTSTPDEVSDIIISTLKSIQDNPIAEKYIETLPFPELPELNDYECINLLDTLSSGKAISFDLFSDLFLRDQKLKEIFASKLSNLWSKKLNVVDHIEEFFMTRVVPLNKAHPNIPKPDQFRPIIIMSIILKILEARWLPKLNEYMLKKILPSQTGFVAGQGVLVNLFRAINRIKMRTDQKKKVFALFIDLKSAYNYVDHRKLFQRLAPVLNEEEIEFERAIYSRIKICHGKFAFSPNMGVAQGSIVSPAFFNIYLDTILKQLVDDLNVPFEDIFAYADDILILVDNLDTMDKVIEKIELLFPNNNMVINKSKSAIMLFKNRRAQMTRAEKEWKESNQNTYKGYPIVKQYKYLGTILDEKLTLGPQMKFITKKTSYITKKLMPLLISASLDLRHNLWQTFIAPLFEYIIPLVANETYQTQHESVNKLLRKTLRKFTLLKKNTPKVILDLLTSYNLENRVILMRYQSHKKWQARLEGNIYEPEHDLDFHILYKRCSQPNGSKWMPGNFVTFLNLTNALCPECNTKQRCDTSHLQKVHNLKLHTPEAIIQQATSLREEQEKRKQKKLSYLNRTQIMKQIKQLCQTNIVKMKIFFRQ